MPLARICYRSRGSFGRRACSPPCPNSPGLTSCPASSGPLPRVYPMNSRCARNHGGPPRVYKERSGPPTFPRRGNVGVSSARPPNVRRWGQRSAASYRGSFLNALLPAPPAWAPLGNQTPSFSTKYPPCQGSVLPIGGEICRKNRKKNSGLGFVKEACFLLGKTGAKFVEPRPGNGN